jgi:S-formylglutathione hydrolase FrmB
MNIATIRLESTVLFMPTEVTVLMPEDVKAADEKFKVVWLLHGAGGDSKTFLYTADFDNMMAKHRILIVMPSALNSDYGSYPRFGRGYDFPRFFFEELMPFIYDTFAASRRPEDNYIEGASMGGFGAMSLGLAHPEKFHAIGMLGASLRESSFLLPYQDDPDCERFRADALADPRRFPTEYGSPAWGIKPKEVNVIAKYPTIRDFFASPDCMWNRFPEVVKEGRLPQIYVACGKNDLFYEANLRFQALVEQMHVTERVHFHFADGVAHDEPFFDAQLGAFMDYYQL